MEIWKSIPGTYYEASSLGRIRSLKSRWGDRKVPLIMTQQMSNGGYLRVKTKKAPTVMVARLVAAAFYGWKDGLEVDHLNFNKKDNRPENLEWVTSKENTQRAFKANRRRSYFGIKNPNSKLTDKDIYKIRKESGTIYEIGARYGVSGGHVSRIRNNKLR